MKYHAEIMCSKCFPGKPYVTKTYDTVDELFEEIYGRIAFSKGNLGELVDDCKKPDGTFTLITGIYLGDTYLCELSIYGTEQ